jgi:hypothetical protein
MFVGCEGNFGVRGRGRTGGFNKVSGHDLVCERGSMAREQLDRLLNPESMTAQRTTPATDR